MNNANEVVAYREVYGSQEVAGLVNGSAYHQANSERTHPEFPHGVDWYHPDLKVTRLRLLSDPGVPFWDVSYCDGQLDGYHVKVCLPFDQLPKRGFLGAIVKHAQQARVFAKRLGILDAISTLQ